MGILPHHGRIVCSRCFPARQVSWGSTVLEKDRWRLENNPGAWGGINPVVLVLGFSKAPEETKDILRRPFDEIPFARGRANLTRVLRRAGLLREPETVEDRLSCSEQDFAFGSLVRCGLSRKDAKTRQYKQTGSTIQASTAEDVPREILEACARQFLGDLPSRLRLVIMLGNNDHYVNACFTLMKRLHPKITRLNEMAYGTERVAWAHLIDPVRGTGGHLPQWLTGTKGRQAEKRDAALDVIESTGVPEYLDRLRAGESRQPAGLLAR